ncbi:helix-turn-helix domain-containing protein [Rhizobium sp. CB3171]|uniref:winged helix-turn-helix transcriptional regulator n=1 Tax=Rhizobium sp. CB3171 TaxID=3039157 RepID=UPI0024B0FFB3|nr:helix-turn-helix domain-containing protein [Rhizobium sp. CB3171]WFU02136.1 helix-turn-helix domain-containing protein [Rhizobium sp. CB3171]
MAKDTYNCAVEVTVDVAGGKWKPIIIYHLLKGPQRFGELRRMVGNPAQRSITLQLRQLEEDGIIRREVFAEVPPRVEYSLTEFGKTLGPVLKAMKEWGDTFMAKENMVSKREDA